MTILIYVGIAWQVRVGYAGPVVELTYIKQGSEPVGDAGDPYNGYDRFGRTVDVRWRKTTSGNVQLNRIQHGFDRNSRRTWRRRTLTTGEDNGSYVTPGARTGNFDKGDVNPQNKGASQPQVLIVHETGHMLGLPHPGQDQSPPAAPNSSADYSADRDALMGAGMNLRIRNFDRAFCDQISTGDSNCDPWKGQTK